jgi:hypothetical protein
MKKKQQLLIFYIFTGSTLKKNMINYAMDITNVENFTGLFLSYMWIRF